MLRGSTLKTRTVCDQPGMLGMTWRWELMGPLPFAESKVRPSLGVPAGERGGGPSKSSRSSKSSTEISFSVSGPQVKSPVTGSCAGSMKVISRISLARYVAMLAFSAQKFFLWKAACAETSARTAVEMMTIASMSSIRVNPRVPRRRPTETGNAHCPLDPTDLICRLLSLTGQDQVSDSAADEGAHLEDG